MSYQRVLFDQLHIRSPHSTRARLRDSFGNHVSEVHVAGPLHQLQVQVLHTLRVTARTDAQPAPEHLTPTRVDIVGGALQPFAQYAAQSFSQAASTAQAARSLCRRIQREFRYEGRTLTDPYPSALATLERRAGNCEELAQVAIDCLRAMSMHALFVSGYLLSSAEATHDRDRLHAWVLVDCAEDGWLELDPTTGKEASDAHVLIAWGEDAAAVRPVTGRFEGGGEHHLTTTLLVEHLDAL